MNIPGFVQRKGRGGRDPGDQPISVVVLGSRPEDAFYFHHQDLLSNPDDRYLQIKLDEENQFVRTEHLVSSIFDYLNLTDNETADEIYRRLDIDKLETRLTRERSDIQDWLQQAFPAADEQHIQTVLDEIDGYVQRTKAPTTPPKFGDEIEPFWKAARIPRGTNQSEIEGRLDDLKFKRRLFNEMAKGNINLGDGE